MKFLVSILLCFLIVCIAANPDPKPTGGANCTQDIDCGGVDGGKCVNLKCVCSLSRGNPDCTYTRKDGGLCGGLQFLAFTGVNGIGNFVCGRTGAGVAQILLGFAPAPCVLCAMCVMATGTRFGGAIQAGFGFMGGCLYCLVIIGAISGFIWSLVDGAAFLQGKLADGNGYATFRA